MRGGWSWLPLSRRSLAIALGVCLLSIPVVGQRSHAEAQRQAPSQALAAGQSVSLAPVADTFIYSLQPAT
ncbi:hypothetical protein, partial [Planobispora takensis]